MRYTYNVHRVASRDFTVDVKDVDGEQVTEVMVIWCREKWSSVGGSSKFPVEVVDGAIRAVELYIVENGLTV